MHRSRFSSSSGDLRGFGSSVGARVCSDVVGDEAQAEGSAASDDRLGMGHTDGVGPAFRGQSRDAATVVDVAAHHHNVHIWWSRTAFSKRTSQAAINSVVSPIAFSIAATRLLPIKCGFQRVLPYF